MNTSLRDFSNLILCVLLVSLVAGSGMQAQISDKVLSVNAATGIEGQPLTISAQLANTARISQVLLAYKMFGSNDFKQIEASLTGNTASATISGNEVVPTEIDYYFILKLQGKDSIETSTYPDLNPETNPLRLQIEGAGAGGNKTVLFLSPDPGSSSRLEDLLISISLINADTTVDRNATKLFVEDRDVTKFAVISQDLVTLVPENIDPPLQDGPHSVRVELYKKDGTLFYKTTQSFTQVSASAAIEAENAFRYNLSSQAESRHENLQDIATPYNRFGLNANSQYGNLEVNGRLYITNEDKENIQPQNRYLVEAKTPWLKASYGDAYPVFPSLILNGKRVRGATANLALGFFNIDFAQGEITRKIEGDTLLTFRKSQFDSVRAADSIAIYGRFTPDDSVWAKYRYGTFKRTLTAIRPSFGNRDHFQWGFSYLKSKDETGSILYGIKPQENLALGTDMTIAVDNKNFLITAQAAASARNNDISGGTLTDAQIDSLYNGSDSTSRRDDIKKIRDRISPYMTVNQNVIPLSAEKIASIAAGEAALSLNYFNNFFKAGYLFHGSQYASFGQTYLRNDIKGSSVYDRLRLAQNQLFVSVGIERLEDNLDQSKIATTTFTNFTSTISYFPRMNFPNLTIGYGRNTSSNGLNGYVIDTTGQSVDSVKRQQALQDSSKLRNAVEDVNSSFFIQIGYDLSAGGIRHNFSLGVSTSSRDDKTLQQMNTQNTTISAQVTTTWQSPLQTSIGVTQNMNKNPIPTGQLTQATLLDYNYTTLLLRARYGLMENKAHLSGMFGPTFGDFKRTFWNAAADYLLMKNVTLTTDLSLLQNPGFSTDTIWSLMLRYNM